MSLEACARKLNSYRDASGDWSAEANSLLI